MYFRWVRPKPRFSKRFNKQSVSWLDYNKELETEDRGSASIFLSRSSYA